MLLGIDNKIEFEILLSEKRCSSLVTNKAVQRSTLLNSAAVEMITHFLEVAIAVYQADLFYLIMPLLVNAVKVATSQGSSLQNRRYQ